MTVGEVCNRTVIITTRGASVFDAVRLMKSYHVGDLIVVNDFNGHRMPIGIITDRDVALALVDWPDRLAELTVGDVMNADLVIASEHENLHDVLTKMQSYGIRRLPIVNANGGLEGIVALDDVIELLAEELTDLAKLVAREQRQERRAA